MRVFLSHSSKDKGFVERVASQLRPGTYALDSQTFDAGLVNSEAIRAELQRSDLFCLFLSKNSIQSSYVEFETLLGIELIARGGISQFLAVCLDPESFSGATEGARFYNIVRRSTDPDAAARLIQGQLITASLSTTKYLHPFIGREEDLAELERRASDYSSPPVKAFYFSGNSGTGRRSLAKKFFGSYYPQVGHVFPEIKVGPYDGAIELYMSVLSTLRPTMTASELRTRLTAFGIASEAGKVDLISQQLNGLCSRNEAAFVIDDGGVLSDDGEFSNEINQVVAAIEPHPNPPAVFISGRMVPFRFRRSEGDVIYHQIHALSWDETLRLVSALLKRANVRVSSEEMNALAELADNHPYNAYRVVELAAERGPAVLIADPRDLVEWKHRQSSEYLSKIELSDVETSVLAVLKAVPELDMEALLASTGKTAEGLAEALQRLGLLHVIDGAHGAFSVAPALRIAVQRDPRARLAEGDISRAMQAIAESLSVRIEEGTASVSMVNSVVLSSIEGGSPLGELATAFLLPSHYVSAAKARYDQHRWTESIRFGLQALEGHTRLSSSGLVAACRYLCLAAARTGNDAVFDTAIKKLTENATDNWAKSNVDYLKGFQQRMRGRLPSAQAHFEKAYELAEGNSSAIRELAAISLARGNLDRAETLAREAYQRARQNAYLVDMLLAVLLKKGRHNSRRSEVDDLFKVLEDVGEREGRSFFTTRRAEFEYLWGDNSEAARLIEAAAARTPRIFEVRRLQVEIHLKDGNRVRAGEALEAMAKMMDDRDVFDRRSSFRTFLETKAHYLTELGDFEEAKQQFGDSAYFTDEERAAAVKDIEISQAYRRRK